MLGLLKILKPKILFRNSIVSEFTTGTTAADTRADLIESLMAFSEPDEITWRGAEEAGVDGELLVLGEEEGKGSPGKGPSGKLCA